MIYAILVDMDNIHDDKRRAIDSEYCMHQHGFTYGEFREIIVMLMIYCDKELSLISDAYQSQNWEVLCALVHKFKATAGYSGALRLNEICILLEKDINEVDIKNIALSYQKFLEEIEAVKQAAQKITQGSKV